MIALVTDSTACLTPREARCLGARVVGNTFTVDGQRFTEGMSGCNQGAEELIAAGRRAATRQPSASAFAGVFSQLLGDGFDVLCVTLSSRLGGAYAAAKLASRRAGEGSIVVLDSQLAAGGIRYLLLHARELANQGLSLLEIAGDCCGLREKIGMAFSVSSMDSLRRSGRMGYVRQSVSTMLGRRPILALEGGAVVVRELARGQSEQARLLAGLPRPSARSLTVHGQASDPALRAVLDRLRQRFPYAEPLVRELPPSLDIHLGPGAVVVAWQETPHPAWPDGVPN